MTRYHIVHLARNLIVPLLLVSLSGVACQRTPIEEPAPLIPTTTFHPGFVATQLARPSQDSTSQVSDTSEARSTPEPVNQTSDTPGITPVPPSYRDTYLIDAQLEFDLHQLDVNQEIMFTNRTGEPLQEIWLVVEAERQDGVIELFWITWDDEDVEVELPGKGVWRLVLPAKLAPGQAGTLEISYRLSLQEGGGALGYSSRQMNFGDWYVRIPPYKDNTGWLIHEPGTAGEHNVYDVADFKVQIDLGAAGQDLVVAASALAKACGEGALCYEMSNSRGFAWSVSEDYQVLEAFEGGILLQQFIFPEHLPSGQAALEVARAAVRIFQEIFGPYPFPSLAMVEAGFFDGMEYPGLFFLGEEYFTYYDGTPKGYLTSLTAHEIAHEWWFSLVGNDQAMEPWLDEALATYSELVFYQAEHPDLEDWWWEYRVMRFQPGGYVDGTIYDVGGFRPYVNAVYLRGAQFLQELRVSMGDESFMKFLNEYLAANEGNIATAEDFFSIAEKYIDKQTLDRIRGLYFSS